MLRGVYVAVVTPFAGSEAVDIGALERLAADCLEAGAEGIVALSTTGEATSLNASEQADAVAACARACAAPGASLIAAAGPDDNPHTLAPPAARAQAPR